MHAIRGRRVVLPERTGPASVWLADGRIDSVRAYDDMPAGADLFDAGDLVVMPGLVDSHVHINEPGRTEWEGFNSATRAAAAGGVTTLVDMPLNSIPATVTVDALEAKRAAARGRAHVDVAFWGGVVPGNAESIAPLIDAGVRGFKCFLVPSGVDEFPAATEADLRRVLPALVRRGVPLLAHAELATHLRSWTSSSDPRRYGDYLATRPPAAEVEAIRLLIGLAREFDARIHVVHVTSAEAVDALRDARASGIAISGETCPHYLTLEASAVPDGATEFKCAPPIREKRHQDALWAGLADGTLGMIVTDHSPAPPAIKTRGDFARAWGGIASLEVSLPAVWTAAQSRGFGPHDLARWMCRTPSALAGLGRRKGVIAAGYDADFVVWDPDAEVTVDSTKLEQRHKITPYAGQRLRGQVHSAFVRGHRVWHEGRLVLAGQGSLQ